MNFVDEILTLVGIRLNGLAGEIIELDYEILPSGDSKTVRVRVFGMKASTSDRVECIVDYNVSRKKLRVDYSLQEVIDLK